jgi:hypothetical protein
MKIIIRTIPHRQQRYETIGDWFTDSTGTVRIYISELNNWRYELLVGVHEVVEAFLCLHVGITQEAVDKFDKMYIGADEPGDEPGSPYQAQHCIATGIERILASLLGVRWKEYEASLDKLCQGPMVKEAEVGIRTQPLDDV